MPLFIVCYDVNQEADSELKVQCLTRGFTDCVSSQGKKWRLPKSILQTVVNDLYTAEKIFDEAVAATRDKMGEQIRPFVFKKLYLTACGPGMILSNEECKD